MKFAYARVSSSDQNLSRQFDSLVPYVGDEHHIFYDKLSGKDMNRPSLQTLLNNVLREGDELYCVSLDRLGRNSDDIKTILQELKSKKVSVHILDLPTSMVSYDGESGKAIMELITNIMVELLAYQAEAERTHIKERQAEGIAAAKKRNVKFGRPTLALPATWKVDYDQWKQNTVTATSLLKKYGWSRATFYRKVEAYERYISKTAV